MTNIQITNELAIEMANHGVLFGHNKSKTHPKMKPYVGATKNEIEILKPEATLYSLHKAAEFLKEIVAKKGMVLIVGTNPSAKEAVLKLANKFEFPKVVNRWLGGTMTNFNIMKERLKYYQSLKLRKEKGELSKYTKKEQMGFSKELGKLSVKFDGLVKMERLPDAIFVVDIKTHAIAVREAIKANIPVIAIIDTNDNPQKISYPIIANDHSKTSVNWIVDKILEIIHTNKNEGQ